MAEADDLATRITEIVAEVLGCDVTDLGAEVPLLDLGVDSLAMIEVVIGIEQQLGTVVPDEEVVGLTTVAELASYVGSAQTT